MKQELPPEVPAGLAVGVARTKTGHLGRRTELIAANANIGVAKAVVTFRRNQPERPSGRPEHGNYRACSTATQYWSFVPQISQPIFTAGRLKSTVRFAEAERDDALIQYERTIQRRSLTSRTP